MNGADAENMRNYQRAVLTTLQSIDASLKALLARSGPVESVNDAVCNGPHGDPIVKAKDPRDWTGEPQTGKRFSECPPEYLDMLADRYDYFATKDDSDDKKRGYAKLDGARARAWAARLRAGWTAPAATVDETMGEPRW